MKQFLLGLLTLLFVVNANASDIRRAKEAISSEDIGFMDKLIADGFDVNSRDKNGDPILFYALAATNNLTMAQKLIDAGADVNLPSSSGITPLLLAVSVAPALEERNIGSSAKDGNYLKYQLEHAKAIVKLLLNAGANVNQETPYGTPLMKASTSELNADIVRLLLDAGADVNQKDRHGRTALFYAAAYNCDNLQTLLLKANADVTILDDNMESYMDADKDTLFDDNK